MPHPHVRAPLAALAALGILLTGCTGDDEPGDPASTWTPSGTIETTAPSTAATAVPTEAPPGETARQFIRRWVQLGNHMQATGDTGPFLAVAGPHCLSCQQFAEHVEKIYRAGGSVQSEGDTFFKAHRDTRDQWTVVINGAPATVSVPGKADETLAGGPYEFLMFIVNNNGVWTLVDYADKN